MALHSQEVIHVAAPAQSVFSCPLEATRAFGARLANIVLTAQVQAAYKSAIDARDRARRAATYVECVWPNTPLRTMVLGAYEAQVEAAETAARQVLTQARAHCGLAYART